MKEVELTEFGPGDPHERVVGPEGLWAARNVPQDFRAVLYFWWDRTGGLLADPVVVLGFNLPGQAREGVPDLAVVLRRMTGDGEPWYQAQLVCKGTGTRAPFLGAVDRGVDWRVLVEREGDIATAVLAAYDGRRWVDRGRVQVWAVTDAFGEVCAGEAGEGTRLEVGPLYLEAGEGDG